jgi:hypothetical protein
LTLQSREHCKRIRASLPDIRDEAIFDLCQIGLIAWQFLTQHALLQESPPHQPGYQDGSKQQAVPRSEEQGRSEKEEESTALEWMAHIVIGAGGDDRLSTFLLNTHHGRQERVFPKGQDRERKEAYQDNGTDDLEEKRHV